MGIKGNIGGKSGTNVYRLSPNACNTNGRVKRLIITRKVILSVDEIKLCIKYKGDPIKIHSWFC